MGKKLRPTEPLIHGLRGLSSQQPDLGLVLDLDDERFQFGLGICLRGQY